MQLAQNYPANQSMQYGGQDNRKSYASQSFVDPRLTGAHGYSGYYNGQHNAPTVYPDAVYPSQYTPINNSHVLGHQVPYQPGPNNYKAQYPNSQQPYYNNQLPFAHQPHYTQGSYITQTRPVATNPRTQVKQVKQVIYQQQALNIPQPVRNIQYVPQLNRYMDYVQERIKIPVQKYYTDYYEIEHVTDFVPREYEESVIEMVPEEIIRYRLQYVPVERKIVHIPKSQLYDENGLFKGVGSLADRVHVQQIGGRPQGTTNTQINRTAYDNLSHSQKRDLDESLVNNIVKDIQNQAKQQHPNTQGLYQNQSRQQNPITQAIYQNLKNQPNPNRIPNNPFIQQNTSRNLIVNDSRNINSYSNLPHNEILEQGLYRAMAKKAPSQKSRASRRRSNFVTSDGYFPNYEEELRNMESSLSASRERYF